VLRVCNRVLKRGGRIAFLVITAAPDLGAADLERALEVGHVDAGPGYPTLLEQAGFERVGIQDVTTGYGDTLANWYQAYNEETEALTELLGAEELAQRQARRKRSLANVNAGLIHRYLVTARRPANR